MALPIIPAPAALVAYKFYRIVNYKSPNGSLSGYFSLNTFGIFETVESTTDLALASGGAVATAETTNGSYPANNAIDGNASTTWESTSKAFPTWFQVELPSARVARKFTVSHTQWAGEAPGEFGIFGSNDGSTWNMVAYVFGWNSTKSTCIADQIIRGRSLCADGRPCIQIDLYNWDTKVFVQSLTPAEDGSWQYNVTGDGNANYMIIHHGQAGFKPQVDGPVKAYKLP